METSHFSKEAVRSPPWTFILKERLDPLESEVRTREYLGGDADNSTGNTLPIFFRVFCYGLGHYATPNDPDWVYEHDRCECLGGIWNVGI